MFERVPAVSTDNHCKDNLAKIAFRHHEPSLTGRFYSKSVFQFVIQFFLDDRLQGFSGRFYNALAGQSKYLKEKRADEGEDINLSAGVCVIV